jgi:hypothetical protein
MKCQKVVEYILTMDEFMYLRLTKFVADCLEGKGNKIKDEDRELLAEFLETLDNTD